MSIMWRLIARVFRKVSDAGWSRGAKGSGIWMAVAFVVGGLRFIARLGSRKRDVVFSQELLPGEVVRVAHLLEDRLGRPAK